MFKKYLSFISCFLLLTINLQQAAALDLGIQNMGTLKQEDIIGTKQVPYLYPDNSMAQLVEFCKKNENADYWVRYDGYSTAAASFLKKFAAGAGVGLGTLGALGLDVLKRILGAKPTSNSLSTPTAAVINLADKHVRLEGRSRKSRLIQCKNLAVEFCANDCGRDPFCNTNEKDAQKYGYQNNAEACYLFCGHNPKYEKKLCVKQGEVEFGKRPLLAPDDEEVNQ